LKEATTVKDQEEDRILIDFLNDNLKIEDGHLVVPEDNLPSGFFISFWRQSKRRMYPYTSNGVEYNVTISEEVSEDRGLDEKVPKKSVGVCRTRLN
jgi:hypothetical protein